VGISATANTELKARPVGSLPTFSNTLSGPSSSIASACEKTFEIDWMENAYLISPIESVWLSVVTMAMPNSFESTWAR
jgi:hypothetical protein